jgi:hypothetical protein
MMRAAFPLVLVVTAAALGVSACLGASDDTDATVQAILADPMASFTPRHLRLLSSFSIEGNDGFPEASSAFLSRLFAARDQAHANAAQRSLRRRADAGGWATSVRASGDLVFGMKKLGAPNRRFWAELIIGDFVQNGRVRVTVRIEDCRCAPST